MVVATGFFDGVHTGHQELINELVSVASERHTDSLVITFWPHPRIVLHPDEHFPGLLTSLEERREKLLECGVDRVEVIEFTKDFSSLTAAGFIDEYVKQKFGADVLVMGYDNRLGRDLKGPEEIRSEFAGCSPEIITAGRKDSGGMAVSSTRIRGALSEGNIGQAVCSVTITLACNRFCVQNIATKDTFNLHSHHVYGRRKTGCNSTGSNECYGMYLLCHVPFKQFLAKLNIFSEKHNLFRGGIVS